MSDDKKLDALEASVKKSSKVRTPVEMGHYGIKIDSDGAWYHAGTRFTRIELVKLFSTVLKRNIDGTFWLETPAERGQIDVDDSPFVAVEMQTQGEGENQSVRFRTNIDDWVSLDLTHSLRISVDSETGEPRPYIHIRDGLEARLLRSVFYELVDLSIEDFDAGALGVWSDGHFHRVGQIEDCE